PGYVGYDEGGQLTEAVRRKPYCIVLFDEIEKAHYDVVNVLLQILDDGRLTDGKGRTVNFKNTVLIMTSNIGSEEILSFQKKEDGDYSQMKALVLNLLRQHFRPEFLNRIDEMIVFHALKQEQIEKIAALLLQKLSARLRETSRLDLRWDEKALAYLAGRGYDQAYGARPLQRLIQQEVETPFSRMMVKGELLPGDIVTMQAGEAGLQFKIDRA
ncbi:MAG: AAA family ATPase, partial [Firmicutes bacterium]|nr:AAA family ATPase [Bacillota bacterium]